MNLLVAPGITTSNKKLLVAPLGPTTVGGQVNGSPANLHSKATPEQKSQRKSLLFGGVHVETLQIC